MILNETHLFCYVNRLILLNKMYVSKGSDPEKYNDALKTTFFC